MEKIKSFISRYREIIMYLIFGVLTTAVSWGVYFGAMAGGRALFSIPADDTVSARYLAVYTSSQLLSWVCAVLFAFFTNRAWVFVDRDKSDSMLRQLTSFAAGRVLTLGLDYFITLAGAWLILFMLPSWADVGGINLADLAAKGAASVVVMTGNYIFSRLFVFRREHKDKSGGQRS